MEIKTKMPPQSKESEMMVLGCMLTSINSLNIAASELSQNDFYYSEHKMIFQVMHESFIKDRPVDVHLVCEELKRQEKLKIAGGISQVVTLAQYAGTSAYIEEYVREIKNKALLRGIISCAQMIEKKAFAEPDDAGAALDEAQQILFQLSQNESTSQGKLAKQILNGELAENGKSFIQTVEDTIDHFRMFGLDKNRISGTPTNFYDFDKLVNGLNDSNLMILAARPAMGKTAFALNIVANVCYREKKPVGIFSLEMSAEQLVHRIVCTEAQVNSDQIKTGLVTTDEFHRIVEAAKMMENHTLIIDDQPGLKVADLRARARRMKEVYDIKLLVIDYLQLLSGSASKAQENRQQEISEISRMLKNLARELNIPIICLSQLSRKVEERDNKRPMMSDLRESGSIEQDADLVMFLFRAEYYNETHKPGVAELIVGKNRHGSIGTVSLTFRKQFAQFANYTPVNEFMPDDD